MEHLTTLGPWGQLITLALVAISGALNCVLAFLNWRARQWKTAADSAVITLEVTNAERDIWKERGERLTDENRALLKDYATLQARTDLQPLVEAINSWTVEGRGRFESAMQRLEVIHAENTALAAKNTAAMEKVTDTLTRLSERVMDLSNENLAKVREM